MEAPSAGHALSNRIVLNERDWGGVPYVVIKGKFVYATLYVFALALSLSPLTTAKLTTENVFVMHAEWIRVFSRGRLVLQGS